MAEVLFPLHKEHQVRNSKAPIGLWLHQVKVLIQHSEMDLARGLLTRVLQMDSKNSVGLELALKAFHLSPQQRQRILSLLATELDHSIELAHSYFHGRQFPEAKELYFELLTTMSEVHPQHFEIYKNLGNIFCHEADFDAAEEYYMKALTLDVKSCQIRCNLGFLEIQRHRMSEAQRFFALAIEQNKDFDKAWTGMGLVSIHEGDFPLAEGHLLKALDLNPDNRVALQALGNLALNQSRLCVVQGPFLNYLQRNHWDHEMRQAFIALLENEGEFESAKLERDQLMTMQRKEI